MFIEDELKEILTGKYKNNETIQQLLNLIEELNNQDNTDDNKIVCSMSINAPF